MHSGKDNDTAVPYFLKCVLIQIKISVTWLSDHSSVSPDKLHTRKHVELIINTNPCNICQNDLSDCLTTSWLLSLLQWKHNRRCVCWCDVLTGRPVPIRPAASPTEHHVFCLAHIKCPVLLQRVTRCNLSWPLLWLVVKLTHILIHNVCLVFVVSSRRTTKWQRSVDGRKSLHKVELLHAATENK